MPIESYPLDNFRRWFETFTNRFFGDDACINAHLRLKQEHTRRTCAEILALAEHLALDERQKNVAEVVALLHDVGRFPQFAEYRTFNDARSIIFLVSGRNKADAVYNTFYTDDPARFPAQRIRFIDEMEPLWLLDKGAASRLDWRGHRPPR